jgi:hypothetical protein
MSTRSQVACDTLGLFVIGKADFQEFAGARSKAT